MHMLAGAPYGFVKGRIADGTYAYESAPVQVRKTKRKR